MKVGDYVRTENYGIKKILDIGEYVGMKQYLINEKGNYVIDNSIIKSSSNIIDLIEVGDYVNGERIQFITNKKQLLTDGDYDLLKKYEDIKSIVTREQFSQMEYRIGE